MLVPTTMPGVTDPQAAALLQPRWARARGSLLTALAGCPWTIVALCVLALVVTVAVDGFAVWPVLPVVGAVVPAVLALASVRGLVSEPPRWVRAAFLTGGVQLLLGVFPAVGFATNAGGAGAVTATVVLVLALAAVALGVFFARRAMQALLTPVSRELGATPFTVAVRARLHDTGLVSGSVSIGRAGLEWAARRHRATGHGHLSFSELRDVVPTMLPGTSGPVPWLALSDGSVAQAVPGPAVLLRTSSQDVLLPVDEPHVFVELLSVRVAAWRATQFRCTAEARR
ncbi:hypothetical protein [Saccharomonospora sp.]|uniref:hypothetical protein n=1 Tax=Saccharomonospora sp. TaxID=33913 RepID=UPI00261F7B45|nr:hypothetical protein [Saccharomonospora sp.]